MMNEGQMSGLYRAQFYADCAKKENWSAKKIVRSLASDIKEYGFSRVSPKFTDFMSFFGLIFTEHAGKDLALAVGDHLELAFRRQLSENMTKAACREYLSGVEDCLKHLAARADADKTPEGENQ